MGRGVASKPHKSSAKRKITFRRILEKKREDVIREIEELLGRQFNEDLGRRVEVALDVGDRSVLTLAEEIDLTLLEMKNRVRRDVEGALRRLEEGTYGICEGCGNEISEGRLRVMPFAHYCVPCREKQELLEKIEREEERFE